MGNGNGALTLILHLPNNDKALVLENLSDTLDMATQWHKIGSWVGQNALLWVAFPLGFGFACETALKDSEVIRYLRQTVELAFDFKVRRTLGKEPVLSPRLKIIAYDDPAAEALETPELPDSSLLEVIEGLRKVKPAVILVDRTFVFGVRDEKARLGFHALRDGEVPVAVGAYLSPMAVGKRPQLDESRSEFSLLGDWPWLPVRPGVPYGPHPTVVDAFSKIGHMGYSDAGLFEPFQRFRQDKALPHLALHAADSVALRPDGLWINERPVPLLNGQTLVNLLTRERIAERTFSMAWIFKRLESGRSLSAVVQPNDVVLVTVGSVTGNSGDRQDTPLGRMRSSQLLAAEVNSVITSQWIHSVNRLDGTVFVAVELALALGLMVNSLSFSLSLLGVLLLWVGTGLYAFSYLSLDLPWLVSAFTLICVAVAQHLRSVFKSQMMMSVLKQALHRVVAADKLDRMAKKPHKISLAPQEQVVSILFFDLVGFSLLSEKRTPSKLFFQLKDITNLICEIVYEHGGMVDKILGDGALCTFGFSLEADEARTDHADRAVNCAIAIQNCILNRNILAGEDVDVFPVRIGVHSSPAFMGDLGASGMIDITVIGPGVNFAKRLEEACEPYRIMLSGATRDLLRSNRDEVLLLTTRRDIGIKHQSDLFEAYEINPFHDRPEVLLDVLRRYWTSQGLQQMEERYLVDETKRFPIHFPMGTAYIEDYSRSGMRLNASFYISAGVQTTLSFEATDCPLFSNLAAVRLTQVQVLVKWGRPLTAGRFALGVQFVGMPQNQRQALIDTLRQLEPQSLNKSA